MLNGHGGNIYNIAHRLGCLPSDIIDMSSNVNPLGPPPGLLKFLKDNLNIITALPEVDSTLLVHSFANRYGIDPSTVLAGNGSTQFIYSIPPALGTNSALILGPTYADYADACRLHNIHFEYFITQEPQSFKPDMDMIKEQVNGFDTVFICNPNNPTGTLCTGAEIESLCRAHPNTFFVIDESYLPFVTSGDHESMIGRGLPNVVVLNSMSKIFRISGLRIGFLIASKNIIESLARYLLPWSVNALAQAGVQHLMKHTSEVNLFIHQTMEFIESEKNRFTERLQNAAGIKLFKSTTSFMLAKLVNRHRADEVCHKLLEDRILIRNCSNFKGLSNHFIRISLKNSETNLMLVEKLLSIDL
ncbi:MAG: pyridoxal phosphate-dependent class II aminotransferase [Desulfobacterales bacterium]|jgi:threonine-phosphate decarboxylase